MRDCVSDGTCNSSSYCEVEVGYSTTDDIVVGHERLLLASYSPLHTDKNGNVTTALIRTEDLIDGKLSVWRSPRFEDIEGPAVDYFTENGPAKHEFHQLLSPSADQVRSLQNDRGQRLFCVVDDKDAGAGMHEAHAAIRLCSVVFPSRSELNGARKGEFKQARQDLRDAFRYAQYE